MKEYKFDIRASDIDKAIMMLENLKTDKEFLEANEECEIGDIIYGPDMTVERIN